MKFKVYSINNENNYTDAIVKEAGKVAAYSELDERAAASLKLLSEELCGLLPGFAEKYHGEFWIEGEEQSFELHVSLEVDEVSQTLQKERKALLDAKSKNGRVSLVEKMREALDRIAVKAANSPENKYYFEDMQTNHKPISQAHSKHSYSKMWILSRHNASDDVMSALEKSIFASLADDVLIGVVKNKIDIIVLKAF